jgi:hypothetical protein
LQVSEDPAVIEVQLLISGLPGRKKRHR